MVNILGSLKSCWASIKGFCTFLLVNASCYKESTLTIPGSWKNEQLTCFLGSVKGAIKIYLCTVNNEGAVEASMHTALFASIGLSHHKSDYRWVE